MAKKSKSKKPIPKRLAIFVGIFVIVGLLYLFLANPFYKSPKQHADIMNFADELRLKKIDENEHWQGFFDDSTDWYSITYQSDLPMQTLHDDLKLLLTNNGYVIDEDNFYIYDPNYNPNYIYDNSKTNVLIGEYLDEIPYWTLKGKNNSGWEVYVKMTSRTKSADRNASPESLTVTFLAPLDKTPMELLFPTNPDRGPAFRPL